MEGPRVTVVQGDLLGRLVETSSGRFYSFQGIPYAKPPLGLLRFKPPVEGEPWEGVRDATTEGNQCSQIDIHSPKSQYIGSEDCLYLNVYTPILPADDDQLPSNKPVIVFVHGGAYHSGSGNSDMYGPDHLVTEDVVLVTINYRLGPLGFLCLHVPDAPGNAGLRDQILALKWIKKNIGQFGGDADNITVYGQNAGAVAISHLSTTAQAEGLFHKAILSSASSFNDWGIEDRPLSRAYNLARTFGCESSDVEEVLQFLQSATAEELTRNTYNLYSEEDRLVYASYFAPVVEKEHDGIETVIKEHPRQLIKKGEFLKIPYLIGYNSAESAIYLDRTTSEDGFRQDYQHLTPREFALEVNSPKAIELWKKIKSFYFKDKHIGAESLKEIVDLLSDLTYNVGINRHISTMIGHGNQNVFFYRFGYYGCSHINASILKSMVIYGAADQDEQGYIFNVSLFNPPSEINVADARVKERLVSFWTNFAKYSNPTPAESDLISSLWLPASENNRYCMNINDDIVLGTDPDKERVDFWNDLFCKYESNTLNPSVDDPTPRRSVRVNSVTAEMIEEAAKLLSKEEQKEADTVIEESEDVIFITLPPREEHEEKKTDIEEVKEINKEQSEEEPKEEKKEEAEEEKKEIKKEKEEIVKVEEYSNIHKQSNGVQPISTAKDIIRANDPPEDDLPKNIGVNKFVKFFEKLGNGNGK